MHFDLDYSQIRTRLCGQVQVLTSPLHHLPLNAHAPADTECVSWKCVQVPLDVGGKPTDILEGTSSVGAFDVCTGYCLSLHIQGMAVVCPFLHDE